MLFRCLHLTLPGKGRLFLRRGRHPWDIEIFRLCGSTWSMQSAEWVFSHQIPSRCLNSSDNEEDKPVYVCRNKSHTFNVQGVVDSSMRYMLA